MFTLSMSRDENVRERQRVSGNDRDTNSRAATAQPPCKETNKKDSASRGGLVNKQSLATKLGGKMKTDSPVIDPNWENWDENNLDFDD